MQRVIPGAHFIDRDPSFPIFHSFFEINSFNVIPQAYDQNRAVLRGLFEDNDPQKRMIAMPGGRLGCAGPALPAQEAPAVRVLEAPCGVALRSREPDGPCSETHGHTAPPACVTTLHRLA